MILKRKTRYILIEASEGIDMGIPANWNSFRDKIGEFIGAEGLAAANPKHITSSGVFFIVRVNRGSEDSFVAATATVKEIGGRKIGFYTISTSGTIAAIKRRYKQTWQSASNKKVN